MIRSVNGKTPQIAVTAYVNEAAYVVGDVEIGEHASIWPGAVIRGDTGKVVIGNYAIVEDNCVIHSGIPGRGDTFIGEYANIGHGAVMHGKKIGNNVLVGMNAVILQDAEIGNFCLIGAGCVVNERMVVPDNSFVVGVPGKIKGKVPEKQMWWLDRVPQDYAALGEQYKAQGL
ncbi:MAG: gamma carbonic anhydrase family protein [Dehalococcoidales bacterium]|jgi:carbonic anhydrase/acetyltransferase-like protein (isoleucine patch superfamily)